MGSENLKETPEGNNGAELRLFLALSRILTGESQLPDELAASYLKRLKQAGLAQQVSEVLEVFSSFIDRPDQDVGVRKQILANPKLGRTAQLVIVLWFTSAIETLDQGIVTYLFGEPDQYAQGLVWKVIGAHPMALPGGYFGYWHYEPEDG